MGSYLGTADRDTGAGVGRGPGDDRVGGATVGRSATRSAVLCGLLLAVLAVGCVALASAGVAADSASSDVQAGQPTVEGVSESPAAGQPTVEGVSESPAAGESAVESSRSGDIAPERPAGEGVGTDAAEIQIASITHPDDVGIGEDLEVGYTLENTGTEAGTESFVDLNVNGTLEDWDENVTVPAGGTESGTLVFDGVGVDYDVGDVVEFSVTLADAGDIEPGQATVTDDGGAPDVPDLQIASISHPNTVEIDGSLQVEYTIENVGSAEGTESFVDLVVDGTDDAFDDSDENVTVAPGETASGTLVYDSVADDFTPGTVMTFTVELWDFGDSAAGEVTVGESDDLPDGADLQVASIDYPETVAVDENLTVSYTVENVGTETGTDSFVSLIVSDSAGDWDADVTVEPGETVNGTLVYDGVGETFSPGDVIEFGVALIDSQTGVQGQTTVEETQEQPGQADLQLASISHPDTVSVNESLAVDYTVENTGDAEGTESAVRLLVDGTGGNPDDADTNVTVPAGETASGTLSFAEVDTYFDDGNVVSFTVEMADVGDASSGTATVQGDGSGEPDIQLQSLDYLSSVGPNGTLSVDYVIGNVGTAQGTETAVELAVVGTGEEPVDADADVAVAAGNAANGTLTFDNVSTHFEEGDTISFTVELAEFGDSESGTVSVENDSGGPAIGIASVSAPESVAVDEPLTVGYTLENTGDAEGTESFVDLVVEGTDADLDDTDPSVTVPAGGTASGNLTFDNVSAYFEDGDTISFTVQLFDSGETVTAQTSVEASQEPPGEAALQLASVGAPEVVNPDENLEVEYTIENVGDQQATEGVVDLVVDGDVEDSDYSVTVQPGESVNGTLTFTDVGTFDPGETISFSVQLGTAGDIASGATDVGNPDASGSVALQESVETGSNVVEATVTSLDTGTGGWLAVENLDTLDPAETVEVTAGEEVLVAVADIGGIEVGDTVEARLAADSDFLDVLDTDTVTVEAGGEPPVANFETTPPVPEVGETVTLDASDSVAPGDEIVEYRWDVTGDGETDIVETSPTATHTFEKQGSKSVTLTVENSVGQTNERTAEVLVEPETEPPEANLSMLDIAGQGETATVSTDENADVSVLLTNVGGEAGAFEVTFTIGDIVTETRTTDELADGTVITVEDVTAALPVGTHGVTVSAGEDVVSGTLTVEEAAEPAFAVDIAEVTEPVAGEELAATVEVQNTGDAEGTETVTLSAAGLGSVSVTETLDGGESTTRTLALATAQGETGDYELSVSAGDDSERVSATVAAATEFGVSVVDTNDPVEPGATLKLTVEVENTADSGGTQEIEVATDRMGNETASVSLDGGESTTETFTLSTSPDDTGDYEVTVTSETDSTSTMVTVAESGGSGILGRLVVLVGILLVVLVAAGGYYLYRERQEETTGGGDMDRL